MPYIIPLWPIPKEQTKVVNVVETATQSGQACNPLLQRRDKPQRAAAGRSRKRIIRINNQSCLRLATKFAQIYITIKPFTASTAIVIFKINWIEAHAKFGHPSVLVHNFLVSVTRGLFLFKTIYVVRVQLIIKLISNQMQSEAVFILVTLLAKIKCCFVGL